MAGADDKGQDRVRKIEMDPAKDKGKSAKTGRSINGFQRGSPEDGMSVKLDAPKGGAPKGGGNSY